MTAYDPARQPALDIDLPRVTPAQRARAEAWLAALSRHYPDAHCELTFTSPHELLIAVILSAQATDASVNKVTPALFAAFPTPEAFARATPEQIEPYIRTIGLFRSKAKSVQSAMKDVVERFGGRVPSTMDELLTLRGVARKTANCVLSIAYGINAGFVVDTHVDRLSKRFGLAPEGAKVPEIERRMMALLPRERWGDACHMIIWHGRRACKARGVTCGEHPICAEFGGKCELRVSAPGKAKTKETQTQTITKAPARKSRGQTPDKATAPRGKGKK